MAARLARALASVISRLVPHENRFLRFALVEHTECLGSFTERKTMRDHLFDRNLSIDDELRYLLEFAQRKIPRADDLELFPDQLIAWINRRRRGFSHKRHRSKSARGIKSRILCLAIP